MGRTAIKGTQIEDHSIQVTDIDFSTSGQALVTKIIAGTGVTLTSTGIDNGTGEVTVSATGTTNNVLSLDQTVQQTISNGTPLINEGIKLGTTPKVTPHTVGRVYWDNINQTVTTDLNNNVKLNIGEKIIDVYQNTSGVNILAGTPVYITGSNGTYSTIAKALPNTYKSSVVIGLAAQNINNGANGYVVSKGKLEQVNASGSLYSETWINGDVLYLAASATETKLTKNLTQDYAFFHIKIGTVINNNAVTGSILVDVKLDDRSDFVFNTVDFGVKNTNVTIDPSLGKLFSFVLSTSNISLSIKSPPFINRYTECWVQITQGSTIRKVTLLASDANIISANSVVSSGDTLITSTRADRSDLFCFAWVGDVWVYVNSYINVR